MWLVAVRRIHARRVRQIRGRGNAGGSRIAGIFEEVLDRAALHAGFGPPRTVGVRIALVVAVVLRIGVDDDAGGAALLGDVDLDATEVSTVAGNDDFAVQIDVLAGEFVEVFEPAVVGVNDFGVDVAGTGRAVEGIHDARIVVEGIAIGTCSRVGPDINCLPDASNASTRTSFG